VFSEIPKIGGHKVPKKDFVFLLITSNKCIATYKITLFLIDAKHG
jgi:hypothetical protein